MSLPGDWASQVSYQKKGFFYNHWHELSHKKNRFVWKISLKNDYISPNFQNEAPNGCFTYLPGIHKLGWVNMFLTSAIKSTVGNGFIREIYTPFRGDWVSQVRYQ